MTPSEALAIVYDLALDNALNWDEDQGDPSLNEEALRQEEAFDIVRNDIVPAVELLTTPAELVLPPFSETLPMDLETVPKNHEIVETRHIETVAGEPGHTQCFHITKTYLIQHRLGDNDE